MLDYPIWYSISWFFTAYTIMSVIVGALHGWMLSMSWVVYASINWSIIGIVTFTAGGGPLGLGHGDTWQNAVLLYVFAGYFALHGWRPGFVLTAVLFAILDRTLYWLTSNDIFETVPAKYHWIAANFRIVRFKSYIPGLLDVGVRGGTSGYACPLSYIWGVVGLQLFKRIPMFHSVSVALAFLAGKIFMLHLLDSHSCLNPILYSWLADDSESIGQFAYIRRVLIMASNLALIGCILEIFRERAFDIAQYHGRLGVSAVVQSSACFSRAARKQIGFMRL
jgi:hypothetical protein